MNDEQRRAFALALGQPEDTPEDRLHEITAERAADTGDGEPAETPPAEGAETPPNPEERVEQPVAASLPEGVVAIDAEELETLRTGAQTAQQLARQNAEADRDRVITAAMREGRFAPARREHYEAAWARDPEGTRVALTASVDEGGLAAGLVPVEARGSEPQADAESEDAAHEAYMRQMNPQAAAALDAKRGDTVRHRTEA